MLLVILLLGIDGDGVLEDMAALWTMPLHFSNAFAQYILAVFCFCILIVLILLGNIFIEIFHVLLDRRMNAWGPALFMSLLQQPVLIKLFELRLTIIRTDFTLCTIAFIFT